ncbi:MAG: hypothetical protein IJM14_02830 [Lachnospiraceae bacterium]|nr:hypothetical protein [Lachnospiraceae bacterium]
MKDYEEFKKAVYSRIEKGREAKQKRKNNILKFAFAGACAGLALTAAFGIGTINNGKKESMKAENADEKAKVISETDPKQETSAPKQGESEADRIMPFEGIYMYVPDEVPAGEFAGDMYRPDGYSEKIGSALALKLENSEEENYNVLIRCNYNNSFDYEQFDRCVTEINDRKTDHSKNINVIEVKPVSRYYSFGNTEPEEKNDYFKNVFLLMAAKLTKEEILELADKVKGITLLYIGSGVRNNELLKEWEKSREGINAFCEAKGDMYVFEGNNIVHYPDIWEKE